MHDLTNGKFEIPEEAVGASKRAFEQFVSFSLRERMEIIAQLRKKLLPHAEDLARMEQKETGMGVWQDKQYQIERAILGTPGSELIYQRSESDDEGLFLHESVPYGVACAAHPVNHPAASIINCSIMLLAAGNSVIHLLPARAAGVSRHLSALINTMLYEICGVRNLAVCMNETRYEYNQNLMKHPDVSLIVVTGCNDVVNQALALKKKVIAAGYSNPVVLIDAECDLRNAARLVTEAVAFDNNLLCTSEKSAVVVEGTMEGFVRCLREEGACILNREEAQCLTRMIFDPDGQVRREYIGKSAANLLKQAGICPGGSENCRIISFESELTSAFVMEEAAVPVLPLVRANCFEEAVLLVRYIEQGRRHTASIFSDNINHLSAASREIATSIFIKNGSTLYGAGLKGHAPVTFTIANVTGEGAVTPECFVRKRTCILVNSFERR